MQEDCNIDNSDSEDQNKSLWSSTKSTERKPTHYKIIHNKNVLSIKAIILQNVTKRVSLVLFVDITKLKKYEKSKQTNKFKTLYFTCIAHDLRTPINSIMSTNSVLLSQLQEQSQVELIEISLSSCRFLLQLIDDIFDMSRLELNDLKL